MGHSSENSHLDLVNSSGFLFQLAVEHEILKTKGSHNFDVIVHEHPWTSGQTNEGGFIDLVIGYGWTRLVVECKRPRDANWVFLVDQAATKLSNQVRLRWINHDFNTNSRQSGIDELRLTPTCMQSSFCQVRGQGEKDVPLLERIASQLVDSVEAFSAQELQLAWRKSFDVPLVYLPVILTTANLVVCTVDYSNVNLSSGILKNAGFETVGFIKFRKAFESKLANSPDIATVKQANKFMERTVLVANVSAFIGFLQEVSVDWPGPSMLAPWYKGIRP
jgi:hypothetical protein